MDPILKERVSGFVNRFNRFQDYFSDKVLRRWVESVGEMPGSALDNFNVAERAGIINSSERMLEIRQSRNELSHKYIDDNEQYADALNDAIKTSFKMQLSNAQTQRSLG